MRSPALPTETRLIRNFEQLRARAQLLGPKRVAVICAEDEIALTAASDGVLLGICLPVLIGNDHNIRSLAAELHLTALLDKASIVPAEEPVKVAVQMARAGEVDILLKGHMRSDQLLTAVLDRDCGLRTGRVLADIALFPMACADGSQRLVSMGDGGVNVAPDLQQKKAIIESSIETMQCLGVARPKVAILSATEAVTDRMPSTLDARILTEMAAAGAFGDAEVFGPLALDNALFEWAARAKGISHPVAGHADCLVVPNIEAGNLLGKSILFLQKSPYAHIVLGAKTPILIPSRVERAEDKVNAMALGVLFAAR
jgi:phosphate butyryltransferase